MALGTSEGSFWTAATELGGPRGGTAAGILNTGGNLGGMLAPVLTPMIAAHFGWAGGLYFGSLMVLIGMLTWLLVDPGKKIAG